MIYSASSNPSCGPALVSLMGEVLNPRQSYEPSDVEVAALVRKTADFNAFLTRASAAGSFLKTKCVDLTREIGEMQKMGEGRLWTVKKQEKKQFSLQILTVLPKKVRLNDPFSLRFRVIDRSGGSIRLKSDDVFKLKVTSVVAIFSKYTPRQSFSPNLVGPTMVYPCPSHEVLFGDISFVIEHLPATGVKVELAVSCCTMPELKPLLLDPIVVRR